MKTEIDLLGKRINMAPRAHRRWFVVVSYGLFAGWWITFLFGSSRAGFVMSLVGFAGLLVFVSYAGTGTEGGDERQTHRRDRAFFTAHQQLNWALVIALFTAWFQWPPVMAVASPAVRAVFEQLPYSVLFVLVGLYATLPQAILLWTEPDMETES